MMQTPPDVRKWAHDLIDAAFDLGYGIEVIEPGRIRLSDQRVTVTVETVLLSADRLRDVLRDRSTEVA